MALSIKNPETERLARELARTTGEGLTRQSRKRSVTAWCAKRDGGVILRYGKTSGAFKKKLPVCRCWTIAAPMRPSGMTRTDRQPEHGHRHFGADRNPVE